MATNQRPIVPNNPKAPNYNPAMPKGRSITLTPKNPKPGSTRSITIFKSSPKPAPFKVPKGINPPKGSTKVAFA